MIEGRGEEVFGSISSPEKDITEKTGIV